MANKKFQINPNPTFKSKVKIPRPNNEFLQVEFEFKYHPRKELAKIYDKWSEDAKGLQSKINQESSYAELTDAELGLYISRIKEIVIGWEFEDKFDDAAIDALLQTHPKVADAIISSYQEACSGAALGN